MDVVSQVLSKWSNIHHNLISNKTSEWQIKFILSFLMKNSARYPIHPPPQ